MTSSDRFRPPPRPQRVVAIVPPGGSALSVVGPIEVFDVANRVLGARGRPPLYDVVVAGLTDRVCTSTPVALAVAAAQHVDGADTVVVGGGPELPERPLDPGLVHEVARLAVGARRIVSVCGGAFVLGALGHLDGRRCTTHWLWLDALRQRHPAARVEPDALYTEDGPVWTSAGVTAGVDLALQLVRTDGGARLAHTVARLLVVFAHRPGGQSQFGAALRLRPALDDKLRDLITAVQRDPAADHDVPALARRVAMSPRHFSRVFRDQTGETPASFVARARAEAAQRLLSDSDASIAEIAQGCGFGTEATFRRVFRRVFGVAPGDWRARFGRPEAVGSFGGAGAAPGG